MPESVARSSNLHHAVTGVAAAAAVGIFAFAIAEMRTDDPVERLVSPVAVVDSRPVAVAAAAPSVDETPANAVEAETVVKPVGVTLVSSTGKLSDLFTRIGYELDGVRDHGRVPRLFIASLPRDIRKIAQASQRKIVFIKSILPLILHANELILQDRERLERLHQQTELGVELTAEDEAWLALMADNYGLDKADTAALLKRVDVIPPSLAIAQAAEESGWGTSRFAHEGNALFGQRAYKPGKKGIVPKEREKGKTYRVRAFDHLIDGVKAYVHNLNSHFAYANFRQMRARMRDGGGAIEGYRLVGALERYSERGADYIKTIRTIMRVNSLQVFDRARLGGQVVATDETFNPDA